MKKIIRLLSLILCVFFAISFSGCQDAFDLASLKTKGTMRLRDCTIKTSYCYYVITPNGFDIDTLVKYNYYMTITVYYNVKYVKNYNAPLDIGYFGAPGYEVSIMDSNLNGNEQYDVEAPLKEATRYIQITVPALELSGNSYKFMLGSDNVQNILYFSNMEVKYSCFKM